ncbi:MAG: hypothetical protein CBB97_07910 [Candidatus Endolissoclinum sp. TMED37]|nr:MAG: hypothetical protein CBB97_07910 [Candidatus Endolissoclinum sp. TMED37]
MFNNYFIISSNLNLIFLIFFPLIFSSLSIYALYKFFPNFLGSNLQNEKTSIKQQAFLRGYGIIFPLSVLPSFLIFSDFFLFLDFFYIIILTFIGFLDDKLNLSQKLKFKIILICSGIYLFKITDFLEYDLIEYLSIIIKLFIFVFIILFFNQIDGINGLAASTFLISITFFGLYFSVLIFVIPVIITVSIYLIYNLNDKVGIQGDSGSFFLGSYFLVISSKIFNNEEFYFIFLFLSPILFDIVATTLVRFLNNENIFVGHKNNFYQKFAAFKISHIKSTLLFVCLQILVSIITISLMRNTDQNYFFIVLVIFLLIKFLIFLILSYLIQNKKILETD